MVTIKAIELYNNKISDLFDESQKVKIRNSTEKVTLESTEIQIGSLEEVS